MEKEKLYAQKLQKEYSEKEYTKFDELKELNKKVKNAPRIFAYIFGSVASLVLGLGMCLAMKVIGGTTTLMIVGIAIGLIGIGLMLLTYPIYKKILEGRRKKYAGKILTLSNELLNNDEVETSNENV